MSQRADRGPVSRAVLDFHNRHLPLTYPEWKAQQPPAREPMKPREARQDG